MKAEHRHELKTNELAEWVVNLPRWAKENLKTIIYVSVVLILVVGTYLWKKYEKNVVVVRRETKLTNLIADLSRQKTEILRAQAEGRDYSFVLIQAADSLQDGAQSVKNEQMAALAFIKRGEALRAELHYRSGAVGKQETAAQLDKARTSYTEAATLAEGNPPLMAAAKFGLGLCEEELGNFEQAEGIYREITENPSFEYTIAVVQARHRLETMADYQKEVVFKRLEPRPASEKAPVKPAQPQINLDIYEEGPQTPDSTSEAGSEAVPDSNVAPR